LIKEDMVKSQWFVERYELRGTLGRGGMGEVYRGWDTLLQQEVAIKVLLLRGDDANRPTEIARFLREVKIGRALKHPNIVTIYDVGINPETGLPYIVMEMVNSKPLHALLEERHLTIPEMVRIAGEVAEALDYAAQAGVVHRDIKPSNILVDPETLAPKIVDFGIARVEGTDLTQTGTVLGTPCYMSPEQCLGQTVDGRSDVFSLGAVLYEMLANERTFPGDTIGTIIAGILDPAKPVRLRTLRPVIPASLDNVVMKALAKDPKDRFQRGKFFAGALKAAMSTAPPVTLALQPGTFPDLPVYQAGGASISQTQQEARGNIEVSPRAAPVQTPQRKSMAKPAALLQVVQQDDENQVWQGKALLLAYLVYVGIRHLRDPQYSSLIGILNNLIHEGGHLLFGWSDVQFLEMAAGPLFQFAVPIAVLVFLFRQADYFAASMCVAWVATNLYETALYIGDARSQVLDLAPAGDWQYLLITTHLLASNMTIAAWFRAIALLSMCGAIVAGAWMVWRMARSK
jgi:hypothetical protein